MVLIGILGIATKYAETMLSVNFRVKDKQGDMLGGCMFALRRGFKGKRWANALAAMFAVFTCLACLGTGASVQSNSVCGIVEEYVPAIPEWMSAVVITFAVAIVIFGGIKRISSACEKIVPIMAFGYIASCIVIIGINYDFILPALR